MNIVEPTQSKREDEWACARSDPLLLGLLNGMQKVWKDMNFLGQAQEMAKIAIEAHECYTVLTAKCRQQNMLSSLCSTVR